MVVLVVSLCVSLVYVITLVRVLMSSILIQSYVVTV